MHAMTLNDGCGGARAQQTNTPPLPAQPEKPINLHLAQRGVQGVEGLKGCGHPPPAAPPGDIHVIGSPSRCRVGLCLSCGLSEFWHRAPHCPLQLLLAACSVLRKSEAEANSSMGSQGQKPSDLSMAHWQVWTSEHLSMSDTMPAMC